MRKLIYQLIASDEANNEVTYWLHYDYLNHPKVYHYLIDIQDSFNDPRNFPIKEVCIYKSGVLLCKCVYEQTEIVELEGDILPIYYAPVAGAEMVTKVNLETDRKYRYRLDLEDNMVHEHVKRNPFQWLKNKFVALGG